MSGLRLLYLIIKWPCQRRASMNNKLWAIGGSILVTAFAVKQFAWSVISEQVTETRKVEHAKAVDSYQAAVKNSQKYSLPKLTQDELKEIEKKK